ncbi:unnamed protein product [Trichobilharzia regenti]|nr:unnamed protein product [Trichobilharzia regenti]
MSNLFHFIFQPIMSSRPPAPFTAAKLLWDPELNPSCRTLLYRVDGIVEGIDAYYVGEKPEKEITFSNLNDNITFKNLEEMCRHFGTIVEAKIYYHPKTQRHLGIGTSVDKQELEFRTYSHSKKSVHALNNNDITDIPHMSTRVQREISDISNPQEKSTYDVITDRMQTSEVNTVAHKTSCNNQDDAKVQKLRQCEESLEARIQKLLRLNPVQSTSELKDAQHCPVVSDTSCKVTGNLPTTSETYQSTNVHDKLDDIKQSEGPSKMLIQKGNTHSESSKNTQIVTSPLSNRRTLLPTPEVSSENIKGPLFSLHRPPLLKTPYKPCNIQEVVKIIEDVHIVFINELRSIIQRDMTRKLVEGQAFKLFSDWWDSKDRECKNIDILRLERQSQQPLTSIISLSSHLHSFISRTPCSLSSNFKLFGLGMFTGLRSALPKIRRKPRPPTPPSPSANTSASPSKNKSPTFQNNHDINSPRECDTKPTRSPVWKSCQSRTRKGSETSWSDEDNDYVITRCRKLSGSSGSESSTERSKQTPNIRVEKSRKSNERHYERHSESSDVDEKCKYKQSPSKVSFKCSQSPANVHTSDYTSSSSSSSNSDNDDESIQPKKTLPRRAAVPVSDVFTKSSASSTGSSSLSSGDDDNDDESSGPSTEPQNDPEEANRYKKYPSDVLSDLSDISDLSDSKSSIHNRLSPVESFHSEPTQNDKSSGSLDSANSSSDDDLLQMNNSTSVDFPVHNRIPTKPNQLNCQSRPDWSILRASLELPPPDYTKSLTHDYQLSAISRRKQNLGNLYRNDNNYASVTEQRNKPPESDSSSKFSLISDQKVNKYPPYQSPRLPLSTIKNKYAWPNFLLIEHSYFHVPDIGSVIRYRSTKRVTKPKSITKDAESTEFFANSHFTSAENLRKRSWHADSPEDNCDTRDNDPNAYSSAWFNMSKRLNMSESLVKDEEQLQDCKPYLKSDKFSREENRTPKNAETKSKTVKVRGSRELASLLEPVDKSEIRRFVTNSHDTEKDDIHKHLSGERVTSKSRVHFEPRSASEEDYVSKFNVIYLKKYQFNILRLDVIFFKNKIVK